MAACCTVVIMRFALLILISVVGMAPQSLARSRAVGHRGLPAWQAPQCTEITGLAWIRFFDADKTVRKSFDPPTPFRETVNTTEALGIGATPNLMWAVTYDGAIHRSFDAGCTWSVAANPTDVLAGKIEPRIIARHTEPVYFHTDAKMARLWRDGRLELFGFPETFVMIDVDPRNALRLRAVSLFGTVYESNNGGAFWTRRGSAGPSELSAARVDPVNFDRIYAAPRAYGLLVSNDGGVKWAPVAAFTTRRVWDVYFSPVDADVVWVDAWDDGDKSSGLYRSDDGARTFARVAANSRALHFTDDVFALHPHELDTYAVRDNPGVQVIGPEGKRAYHWEMGKKLVWSPAGTLYYIIQIVESR